MSVRAINLAALLLLIVTAPSLLYAQERIGVIGSMSVHSSHASFDELEGVPNCNTTFQSGAAMGPSVGLFYARPLTSAISLELHGLYQWMQTNLTAHEQLSMAMGGAVVPATIDHTINARFDVIGLQPTMSYAVVGRLSAYIGVQAGYVLRHDFDQVETLVQPTTDGAFLNGSRQRNQQSGSIPNATSLLLSAALGVRYALPLNAAQSIHLVPEASYRQSITPLVKGLSWSISSMNISLGLQYTFNSRPAYEPPQEPRPDVPPPSVIIAASALPSIDASLRITGVHADGTEHPTAVVQIEEFTSSNVIPLLPYVFFDDNSATIPSRYTIATPIVDGLTANRNLLMVLAQRLALDSTLHCSIVGRTFNARGMHVSQPVALQRARAIESYLVSEHGLRPSQIHVSTRELPMSQVPELGEADAALEIQRVDLLPKDDKMILAPVRVADTIRTATPPTVRIYPTVVSSDIIRQWDVRIAQDSTRLASFTGEGVVPQSIDWDMSDHHAILPRVPGNVDVQLHIHTTHADTAIVATMHVDQLTLRRKLTQQRSDTEIDLFTLALFDIGSAELTAEHRALLRSDVKPRIKSTSIVTIEGYTDRLGDATLNSALSLTRARNTAAALGLDNAILNGNGEQRLLYDNSTAEARCLCRTVQIRIETPAEAP